jgi:hypothetical protein
MESKLLEALIATSRSHAVPAEAFNAWAEEAQAVSTVHVHDVQDLESRGRGP